MQDSNTPKPNKLIHSSSPYLLQHAYNPVDWHEWSEDVFEIARKEQKLVLISIGYSACHWCHVMESESFEDAATANVMNQSFICIKVDREERPDIDQIYMDACQILTGRGGWPLNIFTLPDGRPIHGGTYFPKETWNKTLAQLHLLWEQNPEKVYEYATILTKAIAKMETIPPPKSQEYDKNTIDYNLVFKTFSEKFDFINGGTIGAPKFPMPSQYELLYHLGNVSNNKDAMEFATFSLTAMALGGIYDRVGGGFSRYSVDEKWFAPHFEKMLYDNAQLISLYAKAYFLTKNSFFREVTEQTINFCFRELYNQDGGFYAALDADSEGEEGAFYVWSKKEIDNAIQTEKDMFCSYFQITDKGNWEHNKNILYAINNLEDAAEKFQTPTTYLESIIKSGCDNLLELRSNRNRPQTDTKILCGWNALMVKALCDAYIATGISDWLEAAEKTAHYLTSNFIVDKHLMRSIRYNHPPIVGFLDDYAMLTNALCRLYQTTFNDQHLHLAFQLTKKAFELFSQKESPFFYFTPINGEKLITRKTELTDDVIPSGNSYMAENLFILGYYFVKKEWIDHSRSMCERMQESFTLQPAWHSNWARVAILHQTDCIQITGDKSYLIELAKQKILSGNNFLFAESTSKIPLTQNKKMNRFYICINFSCMPEIHSFESLLEELKKQNFS